MADFSSNDINEAKRRVREMQERVKSYQPSEAPHEEKNERKQESSEKNNDNSSGFSIFNILGDLTSGEDKGLILALILILSREKADNMLILALLYILL